MSNMIDVLVVDAHKAALMMGGEFVAKCDTKGIAYEIAAKVNSHDKLTEENKMLRESLRNLHDTGVEYFNGSYDDAEDMATVECNFNDALISAAKLLEQAK